MTRDRTKDAMACLSRGTFFWHIDGANELVPNKSDAADGQGDLRRRQRRHRSSPTPTPPTTRSPTAEKAELAGVRVVHSFAASQLLVYPDPTPEQRASWDRVPAREHPLVWTRRNGRKSLLIGATAGEVVGRTADEGRALLDRLLAWATQPQFVLRHHWRRGDLVVWDNTGLLHRALPYASDSPRLMHRTTIAGEEEIA